MTISRFQRLFGVGLLGVLVSLVVFGVLWILDRKLAHPQILHRPEPVRTLGLALIGIWICWHSWCIRTISRWWKDGRLCTTGPFRFVRHPMYAGGIWFVFVGIPLYFNSRIILLWPVVMYAVYSLLVRREEAMMSSLFGEEYKRYAARTGRLFPRFFRS